jgi:sugar transferase (PEP-CTERM/EpsH1 system associated)
VLRRPFGRCRTALVVQQFVVEVPRRIETGEAPGDQGARRKNSQARLGSVPGHRLVRVVFLTHRLPYAPNRGDRIRAYHLLRTLARVHEVHLVSLLHDDEEAAAVDGLRSVARTVTAIPVSRIGRLAPAALSLTGSRPLTQVLLHSPAIRPALQALVDREQPEAAVAFCTAMARYTVEPPLARLPWILDMVDVDSEKWRVMGEDGGPLGLIYRREARLLRAFERRAMQLASATTIVSERERVLLGQIAPESPSRVVPNGIDLESFRPAGPPAEGRDVIFCGVFNYGPNEAGARWLASEVWPLVAKELSDVRLWLVGMHPTGPVRALASDPTVQVTGAVPAVQPFLWRSAIAVAPLQLARGIQNKVLEALAAGLPCVVTPQVLEGLPDGVRAGCRVAEQPASFARAIVELLKLPAAERRRTAARAELSGLNWPSQLAPMLTLLQDAVDARFRPAVDR